eukprot:751192-Amphidinium_carterae.1
MVECFWLWSDDDGVKRTNSQPGLNEILLEVLLCTSQSSSVVEAASGGGGGGGGGGGYVVEVR